MYKTRNTNKQSILMKQDKRLYTLNDLAVLWEIENRNTLTTTVKRYKDRKILYSLKKGLYSVIPIVNLDPYEVGCAVCGPFSYISTETVLSRDGVIMQNPLAVTLLGLKNIDIVIGENRFICRYLNPEFLVSRGGIKDNLRYSIATTERAVADMIHINPHYYFDNKIAIKSMGLSKLQKEVGYDSTIAKRRTA